MIAPFWDDLDPSSGGAIYYLVEGTSPNRTLTIEWHNIPHFFSVGEATFEVILYERNNNIVFQYQDVSFGDSSYDFGKSATVGVENRDGSYGKLYSYNSPNISNGLAVLFTNQTSALYARYAFDEGSGIDATDSSGNGNNGIIHGATWSAGQRGAGLDFDGVDDSVDFTTNLGITDELSVSAWVYPTAGPNGAGRIIATTHSWGGSNASRRGWTLGIATGSTDQIQFRVFDNAGNFASANLNGFFSNNLNRWTHVTGVFKPLEYARLYVNGEMVSADTSSVPGSIVYQEGINLRLGMRADNPARGMWQGGIDEVRVYSRALSDQEVLGLYNSL
ncbi:MAG: LamG domain-containing protein [Candidatus Brocadiaceae bacterium]|nr:LamG domain-containing protein [Candidatus Brocadiaceae bacterium]